MRKIFFNVFVALAVCAGLSLNAAHAQTQFIVGFAQDDMSNDWRAAQVHAAKKAFSKYKNVKFIYTDARGDVARNISDIEDLVDQGINLLIVSPRSPQAMTPVISSLYDSGIPVVLLTRAVTNEKFTTFISPDDTVIAAQAADQVAAATGGKARVLVLQGVPTATTAIKRTAGFVDRIKAHPGLEIVDIVPANYKRPAAIKAVQEALEKGLKFDAIYAQSDSMASGARLALKQAGISPRSVPTIGIDYIPEARAAIRAGEQFASFTYPTCGDEAADVAMRILSGETVPRNIEVKSQMVTRENVDSIDTIF